MPKAKVNKDRQKKVNKFKNKQKIKNTRMSELQMPQSRVADQYPTWSSKANIEMTGLEWEAIYGMLNMFSNAVMASQAVLQRNMANGTIKWVYKDAEGKDVPDQEVKEYQEKVQKFFEEQQVKPENAVSPAVDDQAGVPHLDALVDANGQEIKS